MFLLPLILILFYFEDLYPNIPMELGGVKPKKSILILAPADFEKSDRIAIFKASTDTAVAKSDTLMVYFYNDSKIIFKIKSEADTKGRSARAFEIERGKVNSIQWLGQW